MFKQRNDLEGYLAELLNVPLEDIAGHEDSLLDFGIDSVQIMSLVEKLQSTGVAVSFIQMAEMVTLPAWWALIETHTEEAMS